MKQTLKILTLVAIGVAVGRVWGNGKKSISKVELKIADIEDWQKYIEELQMEIQQLKR